MNAEQKQRACDLLALRHAERGADLARYQQGVIALLQELVDAPEVEPVAKVMHVDGLNSNNLLDCDLPTGTLLYTAPPAPSVPDWLETTQFLTDVTTAAGLLAYGRRDKGLAQRIGDFAYKYRMLAAAPAAPKPPALSDERIFKLFLEKAVDKGTAGIYDFARAIERQGGES